MPSAKHIFGMTNLMIVSRIFFSLIQIFKYSHYNNTKIKNSKTKEQNKTQTLRKSETFLSKVLPLRGHININNTTTTSITTTTTTASTTATITTTTNNKNKNHNNNNMHREITTFLQHVLGINNNTYI